MTDRVDRRGVVATRTCPACGHHEVGILDAGGVFHPLKPGQRVLITEEKGQAGPANEPQEGVFQDLDVETEEGAPLHSQRPWAPRPLMGRQAMRLVFGVLQGGAPEEMTAGRYRAAYLEKLRGMIEREETGPLAFLFDRYLTAPYLASGSPSRIAGRLWEELDEIRSPAALICSWLDGCEGDLLTRALELVPSGGASPGPPPGPDAFHRELSSLRLETFFSLIT